jgi:hypothetical protein
LVPLRSRTGLEADASNKTSALVVYDAVAAAAYGNGLAAEDTVKDAIVVVALRAANIQIRS